MKHATGFTAGAGVPAGPLGDLLLGVAVRM